MSDWGHESEDLFRVARRGLSPSLSDRDRVRSRIRAKIAAAAVGAAMAGTAAKAAGAGAGAGAGVAAKGATLAFVAKIAVPLVLAGAAVAAAPHVIHSRSALTATTSSVVPQPAAAPIAWSAPEPDPVAPVAVDALPMAARQEAPRTLLAPAHRAPSAHASRPANQPAQPPVVAPAAAPSSAISEEEAALVGAIDEALRGGDPASALRLASEHQRRFPSGVLSQEREGARVVAQCMAGARSPAGGSTAFLTAHPRSPMRARIVAACGTLEDPAKTPAQ